MTVKSGGSRTFLVSGTTLDANSLARVAFQVAFSASSIVRNVGRLCAGAVD
jgi:hypothetical protein